MILSLQSIRMFCSQMCRYLWQKLEKYGYPAADLIFENSSEQCELEPSSQSCPLSSAL